MLEVECPHCGSKSYPSDEPNMYDWDSGTAFGGLMEVICGACGETYTVEATATITGVEVIS